MTSIYSFEDEEDMKREEFHVASDICKITPPKELLHILRCYNWDVNESVNAAFNAHENKNKQIIEGSSESNSNAVKSIFNFTDRKKKHHIFSPDFLAIPKFRMVLKKTCPSFIDFMVHILANNQEPIGITMSVRNSSNGTDEHNVLYVKHVVQGSIAMQAGLCIKDIILEVNNKFIVVSKLAMEVSDIYDRVSVLKSGCDILSITCRRILKPKLYYALPLCLQQYYLVDAVTSRSDIGLDDSDAPSTQVMSGNGAVENLQNCLHPYAFLFFNQQAIDKKRVTILNQILYCIKERRVTAWENEYLAYIAQIKKIKESSRDSSSFLVGSGSEIYVDVDNDTDTYVPSQLPSPAPVAVQEDVLDGFKPLRASMSFSSPRGAASFQASSIVEKAYSKGRVQYKDIIKISSSLDPIMSSFQNILRPALCVRVLRSEPDTHTGATVYVVWVLDVKSGCEWIVKKRFHDFFELRENLIKIREKVAHLPFPSKRFKVVERFVIAERIALLEKFLRQMVRMVTTFNVSFLSTSKLRLVVEMFLDVPARYETIARMELSLMGERDWFGMMLNGNSNGNGEELGHVASNNSNTTVLKPFVEMFLQIFVQHTIIQEETDNVIKGYIDEYVADSAVCFNVNEPGPSYVAQHSQGQASTHSLNVSDYESTSDSDDQLGVDHGGAATLDSPPLLDLKSFLDNLQVLVYNALIKDCFDIMTVYGKFHHSSGIDDGNGAAGDKEDVVSVGKNQCDGENEENWMDRTVLDAVPEEDYSYGDKHSPPEYHVLGDMSAPPLMQDEAYRNILDSAAVHPIPAPPMLPHSQSPGRSKSTVVVTKELVNNLAIMTPSTTAKRYRSHKVCVALPGAIEIEESNEVERLIAEKHSPEFSGTDVSNVSRANDTKYAVFNSFPRFKSASDSAVEGGGMMSDSGRHIAKSPMKDNESVSDEPLSNQSNKTKSTRISTLDYDSIELFAQNAIRRQLEIEVCTPNVCKKFRSYLENYYAEQEALLENKMESLKFMPQSYFGISPDLESPSLWYDVKKSLRLIKTYSIPYDRILAYLRSIKLITLVCHLEQGGSKPDASLKSNMDANTISTSSNSEQHVSNTVTVIGADDFLPILIYILIHCKVRNLCSLNAELQVLCPMNLKYSEAGYYLTAFDAALRHILDMKLGSSSLR